jgi:PAS domain S-box-containing protein
MRKAKRAELSEELRGACKNILTAWRQSLHSLPKLNSKKGTKSRELLFKEMDTFLHYFIEVLEVKERRSCEQSLKRMAVLFFQVGLPHSLLTHAQIKLKRILINCVIERFEDRKSDIKVMCDLIEAEIDNNRIFLSDEFEKLALQTLEASERNYRELIEEMEDLVVRLNTQGVVLFSNSASLPLLGISSDKIAGRSLEDFINIAEREKLKQTIDDVVKKCRASEFSCEVCAGGNKQTLLNFRIYPVLGRDRNVYELKGIARDVTLAKKLEQELRKKADEIEMQWEVGRTVSSTMNIEVLLNRALDTLYRIFHYPAASILLYDEASKELYPKASKGLGTNELKRKVTGIDESVPGWVVREKKILLVPDVGKHPKYEGEVRGVKSEIAVPLLFGNKLVGVLDIESPEKDAFGKEDIVRLSMLSSQVASAINNARLFEELHEANEELNRINLLLDRKALELATSQRILEGISKKLEPESILHAISEPLKELISFSSLSLFLIGNRKNLLIVNRDGDTCSSSTDELAVEIMKELKKKRTVAREVLERPVEEYVFGKALVHKSKKKTSNFLCLPLAGEDGIFGAMHLSHVRAGAYSDEEVAFLRNVSSQISLGLSRLFSIREYQSRREEVSRMKSDFSSIISHELRSPITSLKNSIDILLSNKFEGRDPRQNHLLKLARKEVSRLVSMVNDILELSMLESGRSDINQKGIEISSSLVGALSKVDGLAEEKGVSVVKRVSRSLPRLYADPGRLEQILVNLLSNAIKFSETGSKVQITACLVSQLSKRLPQHRKLPPGWRASSVLHNGGNSVGSPNSRESSVPYVEISVRDWGVGISQEKLDMIFEKFTQEDSTNTRVVMGAGLGLTITKHLTTAHDGVLWAESKIGEGSVFRCLLPICMDDVLALKESSVDLNLFHSG